MAPRESAHRAQRQGDEHQPGGAEPDISDGISQGSPRSENRRRAAQQEDEKHQFERQLRRSKGLILSFTSTTECACIRQS